MNETVTLKIEGFKAEVEVTPGERAGGVEEHIDDDADAGRDRRAAGRSGRARRRAVRAGRSRRRDVLHERLQRRPPAEPRPDPVDPLPPEQLRGRQPRRRPLADRNRHPAEHQLGRQRQRELRRRRLQRAPAAAARRNAVAGAQRAVRRSAGRSSPARRRSASTSTATTATTRIRSSRSNEFGSRINDAVRSTNDQSGFQFGLEHSLTANQGLLFNLQRSDDRGAESGRRRLQPAGARVDADSAIQRRFASGCRASIGTES